MSFIYNILYNNTYPFYDENITPACSYIMDINILIDKFIYTDNTGNIDDDIDIRCTDIIISKYIAVISMYYAKKNIVFNATIEKPTSNKIYPVYANGSFAGTIIFKNIPEEQVSSTNMRASDGSSGLRIDNACLRRGVLALHKTSTPFDITDNNINIFVGGSLKSSVETTGSSTIITITDNAEVFMSADAIRIPVGIEYGIRTIAGVGPNSSGNVDILFEATDPDDPAESKAQYTFSATADQSNEAICLDLLRSTPEPRNCIPASTYFQDRLRFSGEDGTSTPYPLDSFTHEGSSGACTPNWEGIV